MANNQPPDPDKPPDLPNPGGPDKKPDDDDKKKPKNEHKSKGNEPSTLTKRIKQGRWRTVETAKVPDLPSQEGEYVEHRPLGF